MKISDKERLTISEAVKAAELKTAGEIVPVILSKSDFYPAAHFRLAMIMGITFALAGYYTYDFLDPIFLIWIQIPGLLLGYALAYIPILKRLFTTKREIQEEVYQRAIEIFYNHQVSRTKDRTGIMIFISLLERRVEVLADFGIDRKVGPDFWKDLVEKLSLQIKDGHIIEGLVSAISECGHSLVNHFPIELDDKNEISNELITDS